MEIVMINLKFSNIKEPFYDVKIDNFGTILYYNKKGKLHNLIGPAIEYYDGYKAYWVNGKRHRLDGPAMIWPNGGVRYYVNDKLHRLDGPAVIYSDGKVEYWVNGKRLTKEEFDELTENNND